MNAAIHRNWEIEPVLKDSQMARVFSPINIALAKYWGKRDEQLNLPAMGSVSITLSEFGSFTTVEFHESFKQDRFILNGVEIPSCLPGFIKIHRVLDELRIGPNRVRIQSMNNFPTAAGLASSASGLSAVTFGISEALGLGLDRSQLSSISRKGSGSSCRSLFDGFVEWVHGERADGTDSVARSLAPKEHWDLDVLICVVHAQEKSELSTSGMKLSQETSPLYLAWVEFANLRLPEFREAILAKNFSRLSELSEQSCLAFHACAMATEPALIYWKPQTLQLIEFVKFLRIERGLSLFFTIDAGPNVVLILDATSTPQVLNELSKAVFYNSIKILRAKIGEGTHRL